MKHELGIDSSWSWVWNAGTLVEGDAFDGEYGVTAMAFTYGWRVRWRVVGVELALILSIGGLIAVFLHSQALRAIAERGS